VAEAIRAGGGSAEVVRLDVCLETEAEAACQRIYDSDGRLDILVNAAGLSREAPALAMEDGEWALVLATNLTGAFRLARSAARYMVLGRWGRIIHISSIAASAGGRGQAGYAASKAGLEALSRVLALELGRKGVAVNAVAPGVIETAMSERVRREHGPALLEEIAVRRFGSPEDVAAAVAFLASDAAAYITGQVLRVDGGLRL
jgi:3-oxoacyl-[acyl-carrier protein] reductase